MQADQRRDEQQQGRRQIESDGDHRNDEGAEDRDDLDPDGGPAPARDRRQGVICDLVLDQPPIACDVDEQEAEQQGRDEHVDAVDEHRDLDVWAREVPDHQARREGQHADEQQDEQVDAEHGCVALLHEPRHAGVRQPHPADEREADEVPQELRPLLDERRQETLGCDRNGQLEGEQGDGDGEDAIGEGVEAVERQELRPTGLRAVKGLLITRFIHPYHDPLLVSPSVGVERRRSRRRRTCPSRRGTVTPVTRPARLPDRRPGRLRSHPPRGPAYRAAGPW